MSDSNLSISVTSSDSKGNSRNASFNIPEASDKIYNELVEQVKMLVESIEDKKE